MRGFYRWQASIYDATRWSFLFGRNVLLAQLPGTAAQTVLEVGCGTGRNLKWLAKRHPGWRLTGVDVSPDMLARAGRATLPYSHRVQLLEKPYGAGAILLPEPVDIVLFSYSLTMFNPGWEAAIEQAWQDLKPGGWVAAVDFHDTPSGLFRSWMTRNHVRMDGHLLPFMEARFQTVHKKIQPAWGGLWQYFLFVGQKVISA